MYVIIDGLKLGVCPETPSAIYEFECEKDLADHITECEDAIKSLNERIAAAKIEAIPAGASERVAQLIKDDNNAKWNYDGMIAEREDLAERIEAMKAMQNG